MGSVIILDFVKTATQNCTLKMTLLFLSAYSATFSRENFFHLVMCVKLVDSSRSHSIKQHSHRNLKQVTVRSLSAFNLINVVKTQIRKFKSKIHQSVPLLIVSEIISFYWFCIEGLNFFSNCGIRDSMFYSLVRFLSHLRFTLTCNLAVL